ncbi:MAG: hypothetical protein V9F00_11120 [Nocardioides sp.]
MAKDGVGVEGDVEGEADDVELVGEARVGVAGAVPVAAEPGGGGVAGGAAHWPAPDLFVLVVEDDNAVGAGAGEVPVEFGLEPGVGGFSSTTQTRMPLYWETLVAVMCRPSYSMVTGAWSGRDQLRSCRNSFWYSCCSARSMSGLFMCLGLLASRRS